MGFVVVLLLPEKVKPFGPLEISQNRVFGSVKIKGIPTQFFLLGSISPLTFTRSSKMIVVTFPMDYMGGIGGGNYCNFCNCNR